MSSRVNTIAKNTLFLYIRTFATMLITIYASRVLLDKLGVDNFGIYNLVGGVILIFGSLRGVFSQSVQRFLNFEKGKGDNEKVNTIFNISLLVHIALAVVFILIVAVFGHYLIVNKLVLPEGKIDIALIVFYTSLLSSVVSIITIPYDSAIIANEKFDFYAWMSILESISKCLIIYLINLSQYDSLIVYSILLMCVIILFRFFHIIYSFKFDECKLKLCWNKQVFIDLASFSGWNFLGNTAFSLTNEGINIVINTFAGVGVNAARGIAYQVKSAVQQLSANLVIAVRPFITESAANQSLETMFRYTIKVSRLSFLVILLTSMPIIVFAKEILNIWLVETPDYAVIFVQLVMIHLVMRSPQSAIDLLFSSIGKMKWYQIVQSITLFLSLPLSYILLKVGLPVYWSFISMIIVEALTLFAIVFCAKIEIKFDVKYYWSGFLSMMLIAIFIFAGLGFIISHFFVPNNIWTFILYFILTITIEAIVTYFILLTKQEKDLLKSLVTRVLKF